MKIKSKTLAILVVVILFGGIFASSAMNMWKTESSKVPKLITAGDFKGEYNPADIRGSYSFGEVSELFNVPLEDLAYGFNIPDAVKASEFKNKDLETLYQDLEYEIGNASVKLFVALYRGLPYDLEEDTYLLESAVEVLKEKALLTQEKLAFLESHTISIGEIDSNSESSTGDEEESKDVEEAVEEEEHQENETTIKGKTTFKELLDWGVSQEKIEEIIELPLPNPVMTIRDYCVDHNLSFSDIKSKLQEEVDRTTE